MLILVRHGRTEANAGGLLQGRLDLPLDDLGRAQAAAAGKALTGASRVVSSPLLRTRQTAEAGSYQSPDPRVVCIDLYFSIVIVFTRRQPRSPGLGSPAKRLAGRLGVDCCFSQHVSEV